jgi:hypothetical protein
MSLEPTFDIFVAYGVVGSSSLVFVILFFAHSLPVGMVSFSSSIFAILSYMFVKDFSSSSSMSTILFLASTDPSSGYKQV